MWMKQTFSEQRKILTASFEPAMLKLAKQCAAHWSDMDKLDQTLQENFSLIPYCHLVYAIDKLGQQVSSNINSNGIDPSYRGQDLSRRPFSVSLYPKRNFMLSSVYISQTTGRPCLSAVQPVLNEQQFLGFVVADFDIRQLPLSVTQPKHSPLIKATKIERQPPCGAPRSPSLLDKSIDEISDVLCKLMNEHGVFHCTLHYASEQAMVWQMDQPYQYHLYRVNQLLETDIYLAYPRRPYPEKAIISTRQVREVFKRFRTLRLADDRLYLRSGSINLFNGMVGLSFSCEGSQYMPCETFLKKDLSFWFGATAVNAN